MGARFLRHARRCIIVECTFESFPKTVVPASLGIRPLTRKTAPQLEDMRAPDIRPVSKFYLSDPSFDATLCSQPNSVHLWLDTVRESIARL